MLKTVLVTSLLLNIFLAVGLVHSKGGLPYVSKKLGITKPDHNRIGPHFLTKQSVYELLPVDNGKDAIIFLGDSITENCPWQEMLSNPRVKNRGIGGDWTTGVLKRVDRIAQEEPHKLFLLIGLGDLNDRPHDIQQILSNYERLLERIKTLSPKTEIYVQSVLPVRDVICRFMQPKSAEIIALNNELAVLAKKKEVIFIDLFHLFKMEDNQLNPDFTFDGGHLNGKGYLIWKHAIQRYIDEE